MGFIGALWKIKSRALLEPFKTIFFNMHKQQRKPLQLTPSGKKESHKRVCTIITRDCCI